MEKKIKIIYGITKADWGGAQNYVYSLATSLPTDKYGVKVITGAFGLLNEKLEKAGVETIALNYLGRDVNIWSDFISLLKLIKIFWQEKPDIIHLNSSKMGLLGAIAGRINRISKIIFTGHGWAFNEDRPSFQKKLIYLLHRITIILSHQTIAVSEQTKSQMGKKISVIRNGVSNIDFLVKDTARQKLSKDANLSDIWLGTVAELHKNKGLKYLIEAIHLLALEKENLTALPKLFIIGEGERRQKLQERIDRYNLQNNIFLVGRIDEASRYLKAFDIFILPSVTEALPYAVLEAGQAGLPIIASAVGGIPEIITDMENGILVKPKEPDEIAKAITFFLKNPDKMALFGEKIKTKIESDFSQEKMLRETIALYDEK